MGDGERNENEDSEAIRARRGELVRESLRDRLRPAVPVARPEPKPTPCLSIFDPHDLEGRPAPAPHRPSEARRSGSRPWVWIAACVFVASVALALLAVRLLQLI